MSKLNVSFFRIQVIAPCDACFNDVYIIWIDMLVRDSFKRSKSIKKWQYSNESHKISIYLYIHFSLCANGHTNHLKYTHTQIRLLHFKELQHLKTHNSMLSQFLDILNLCSYFLIEAQEVVADRKTPCLLLARTLRLILQPCDPCF